MRCNYLVSAIILMLLFSFSQLRSQSAYFQEVLKSSPNNQEGQDVLPTADGGYLIAGYTETGINYDRDVLVIKTNSLGKEQWRKTYGGNKPDFPYHMLETSDGNYFLIGYSQSFGGGDYDIFLLKIKPDGTLLWQKTYGSWGNDIGYDIIKCADGNYLIVASSNSKSYSDQDANLIKIDGAGNIIWTKYIGGTANDFGYSVKQTSDGGYVMVGQTYSYNASSGDAYLVRLNSNGDTSWTKRFGGAHADEGVYVTTATDGGFVFVVRDSSNTGKDVDIRIIKTNSSGSIVWSKVYGGDKKDTPKMIQRTADGGYIVAGHSRSFGWINPDMWILKCNSNGDTLWTRHYGGSAHEHCYVVRQLSNGSFIAVGKTDSYGPDFDAIFLKINSAGNIAVGVDEVVLARNEIRIFPNPSSDIIRIQFNEERSQKLYVNDLNGNQVYSHEVTGEKDVEVDLTGRPAGLYIVSLHGLNEVISKRVSIIRY